MDDWTIATNTELHSYYELYEKLVAQSRTDREREDNMRVLKNIDAEILKRNPDFYTMPLTRTVQ